MKVKKIDIMDKMFRFTCVFLTLVIIVSSAFMVVTISKPSELPEVELFDCEDIVQNIKNMEMNMTSVIYIKNDDGEWVESQRLHGEENRIWVSIDKMPEHLLDAFIAIEDQRFYSHSGVDWKRTGAAFINWLPHVEILDGNQGGSTITQQLIKNITDDDEQNASRKVREIARALALEATLDKKTILEAYLNTISLGNGICGVQVAANYYFNKDVSELTISEAASLAAITKSPTAYNPISEYSANDERRILVLKFMLEQEKISQKQYDEAVEAKVIIDKSQQTKFEIPVNDYFVDTLVENVIENLSEKYDCSKSTASSLLYNGGLKIYASVDTSIQETMESVYLESKYFKQVSAKDKTKHVESAMTIMDYQGHIVGIVGGTGEKTENRSLNRAYSVPRQPGSTMKPLGVYAPAIDNGVISYGSILEDKALENYYPDGKKGPKEWYGYYAGKMTLIKAIERSANTIPCHILKEMGIDVSYDFLTQKLHMKYLNETDKNLSSLALGGCVYGITPTESAAAYAIFGNNGKYYKPVTYYKITNSKGETILSDDADGEQVIKPGTAVVMNQLLQNVVYGSQGTGRGIRSYSKMKVYAKTGTSSESNDLWMVAGTPYYVGSVWYGFDKLENINDQAAAATVWKTIMTAVHKDLEVKEFTFSTEVETKKYCRYTGKLAGKRCYWTGEGTYVVGVDVATCDGKHTSSNSSSSSSSSNSSSSSSSSSGGSTTTTTPTSPTPAPTPEPDPTPTPDPEPDNGGTTTPPSGDSGSSQGEE